MDCDHARDLDRKNNNNGEARGVDQAHEPHCKSAFVGKTKGTLLSAFVGKTTHDPALARLKAHDPANTPAGEVNGP